MTDNRHLGNTMNTIQWATHPGIAGPATLAMSTQDSRMLAAAMVAQQQAQPWQQAHQATAAPPQQASQSAHAAQYANHMAAASYGVPAPPQATMSMVQHVANGIGGGGTSSAPGGMQSFRQYDSVKQFGSLPVQGTKRSKISVTSKTNLYISGLSEGDNDETVRLLVRGVVEPKSCKAMMNDGKCKGSGFIDCVTEEDAEKAMQHIMESSKKLSVKYANENEKDAQNVYVRNLPKFHFSNENLQSLFNQYGQVTSVKLLESNGTCTGTGFVRFATAEQALLAVESMNREKKLIGDCDRPVTCKLADKTDPRRKVRASPPLHISNQSSGQPSVNGGYHRRQNGIGGVSQQHHHNTAQQQHGQQQQVVRQQQAVPTALFAGLQNMTLSSNGVAPPPQAASQPTAAHYHTYTSPAGAGGAAHQQQPPQAHPQPLFYHAQPAPAAPYTVYSAAQAAPPHPTAPYTIFPYPTQQPTATAAAHHYPSPHQFYHQPAVHAQQQI